MKRCPKLLILVIMMIMLCYPSVSTALVFGESNLSFTGYPGHNCWPKPTKPYKPYSFNSQWEIDNYNAEVDRYNNELNAYMDCINTYLEGCRNDVRRIKEKANEAVNNANF